MFNNSFNYFQVSYDRNIKLLEEKNTIALVPDKTEKALQFNRPIVSGNRCFSSDMFFNSLITLNFLFRIYGNKIHLLPIIRLFNSSDY